MRSTLDPLRFFLGGRDLEMLEIRALLEEVGIGDRVVDAGLAWGARASSYLSDLEASLAAGEMRVLVELADDLPETFDRSRWLEIDHHGPRAGAAAPTSLEQVFRLVGGVNGAVWTRWRELVATNDKGHAVALRSIGATADEIRAVRDADRAAQGVTPEIEAASRRALASARRIGPLLVVEAEVPTATAIVDFLLFEYGGPGDADVLVTTATSHGFYGAGHVVADLAKISGCWYGGSLPERGFWGVPRSGMDAEELVRRVVRLLGASVS